MNNQDAGEGSDKEPDAPAGDEAKARWQDHGGRNPFQDREIEDPEVYRAFDFVEETEKEIERSNRSYRVERRLDEQSAEAAGEMFEAPESVIPQLQEFVVDPWGEPGPDDAPAKAGMSNSVVIGSVLGVVVLIAALALLLGGGPTDADREAAPGSTSAPDAAADGDSVSSSNAGEPAAAATSHTWSIVDPEGNWLQFDDFDEIIPEREADGLLAADALAATDVTGVDITSDGSSVEIGIDHFGDAQSIQAHARANYRAGLIWITDGQTVDVLYRDDETVKISDAPAAWSVSATWESPSRLFIDIDGVGVSSGDLVTLTVFLELFDGINLQTVEVPTG